MPFTWIDYLQLAQTLAANGDEASKRTAISRAYYFIFNLAYARARVNYGPKPQGPPGFHEWCWDKYAQNPTCTAIAVAGKRLKRKRTWADYDDAAINRLDDVCNQMIADVKQLQVDLLALAANQP
jgi:hypothetical protein